MDKVSSRSIRRGSSSGSFRRRVAVLPSLAFILIAGLVAACGKVPPVTPADLLPADLQSVSTWNPELDGTSLGDAIGTGGIFVECIGYLDAVEDLGTPTQTRLEGWAWNTAASEAFESFVVTDRNGLIAGAGMTVVERADVKAALPDVVSDELVGFVAFSAPDAEKLTIYGVNAANDTVCAVGATG